MPPYKARKVKDFDGPEDRRIRWIVDQFERYQDFWQPEMTRLRRNCRMYWGVDYGQWPEYAVDKLREQGQHPPQYNITAWKIETLVGSFLSNPFDIKYLPESGELDSLFLTLQKMYYSDRHNMDWDSSYRVALRDCFIMMGAERMCISDKNHEFGNIAFEPLNPLRTWLSPSWKSDNVDDIKDYFTDSLLTAGEIVEKYPSAGERLVQLKEKEEAEGIDYGVYEGAVPPYRTTEEKWADRHRVIQLHYVTCVEEDWEYDIKNHCHFPDTGYKAGSDMDREAKIRYIQKMGLDPNFDIVPVRRKRKIKKTEAICPALDSQKMLTKGKDPVQTNNCNIYPLGMRYRGQFQGIVDRLYDIQMSINKNELTIDDIQARSAKGAFLLDKALAGGDPKLQQEIEQGWNDPAMRGWVAEGATEELRGNGIIELPGSSPRADMFTNTQRRYDLADMFSLVPAAMDARTESAKESGILYRHKVEMGLVGQKWYHKTVETHEQKKAEAYGRQAKITYSGYPRVFSGVGEEDGFVVNRVARDRQGRPVTLDDISVLPMCKVVLVPSRSGLNVRSELRANYVETLGMLNDPNDRLLRLILTGAILETQELPDERKQEIKMAVDLLKSQSAYSVAMDVIALQRKLDAANKAAQRAGVPVGGEGAGAGGEGGVPQQVSQGAPGMAETREGGPEDLMGNPDLIQQLSSKPQS